jgi:hypothetical protein
MQIIHYQFQKNKMPDPREQDVIAPEALPTDAQWARLGGFEAVSRLVQAHGTSAVYSWLRMAAALHGEIL